MSFVTSPFKDFGLIPAVHFHPSMAEPLQNDAETADMLPSPTNNEPARTDTSSLTPTMRSPMMRSWNQPVVPHFLEGIQNSSTSMMR